MNYFNTDNLIDESLANDFNTLYQECIMELSAEDIRENLENVEKYKYKYYKYKTTITNYKYFLYLFLTLSIFSLNIYFGISSFIISIIIYIINIRPNEKNKKECYNTINSLLFEVDEHYRLNNIKNK